MLKNVLKLKKVFWLFIFVSCASIFKVLPMRVSVWLVSVLTGSIVLIDSVKVVKSITVDKPDIRFAIILEIDCTAEAFATFVGGE